LVRSYVTRPTTISAITEIPANTPSPIGRTSSFFPGSVNGVAEAEASAAAAEAEVGATICWPAAVAVADGAAEGAAEPDLVVVPITLAGPSVASAAVAVATEDVEAEVAAVLVVATADEDNAALVELAWTLEAAADDVD